MPEPDITNLLLHLQTDTLLFKNWFGDSKVVGAEGKPLVVYHGGTVGDTFDASHNGSGSDPEGGFSWLRLTSD